MLKVVPKWLFVVVAAILLLFGQPLAAQKEGAIWYFGQNAGLDFNEYFPRPLTDGQLNTREGVATICDQDGKLLFYTNGQVVYDRTHTIMDNGEGLLGDVSSTQSSVVVPDPGSVNRFYIFTVDQAGTPSFPGNGLNYSIVDITKNQGKGSVVTKNIRLPNVSNILFTEKITVVKHNDKKSYWIIAHGFDSETFYEFGLNETGITFKGNIDAGSVHKYVPSDRDNRGATGYLKSSPKGDFLVTAVEGLRLFELFTFDNLTGNIRLLAKLPAGNDEDLFGANEAAYGVEFSPTSNFLYGSTRKNGFLYQWDLGVNDGAAIKNSVRIIRSKSSTLCGALQLGLNGKIYVCISGQPYLGVINSPIQKNCNFTEHGTSLIDNSDSITSGGKAYFGLPTFLSDFFKAAQFYYENTCQNDATLFYLSALRSTILGLPSWRIYDADTVYIGEASVNSQTLIGTYRFTKPGKYLVELNVSQFGGTINQMQEVTIHPLPELNLPDTTSMCKGSPAHLDAGDGAFYLWDDNTNLTVNRYRDVTVAMKYIVTVRHYNGCSNTDSTVVVSKPLPVIMDTLISLAGCGAGNGSITLEMEHESNQYDFAWSQFPDNHTNRAENLPFGVYEVIITSRETGCALKSKFSVSEDNAPEVIIHSSAAGTVCPGSKVTLTAGGASNYLWEAPLETDTPVVEVTPMETTTYRVKGYSIDQVTGQECSAFGEITVRVFQANYPQLGADREQCQGDTVRLNGGAEYLSWNWSNNQTGQRVEITHSIDNLILTVTDKNQCLLSDTINVLIKPLPEINLPKDIVQCQGSPLELYGGPGDTYLWSTTDTTSNIRVNDSGTYSLTITTNGCSVTDSTSVTLKPLPEVILNFPRDTTVCLSDSIELNGGRGDSYLWSTQDTTPGIFVNQTGLYTLTILYDGCANSDTVNLTVKPLPVVDLGKDTVYCKASPIALSGGDGDTFSWSTLETSPQIFINETGEYSLTISKDGCFNSDTVNIRINDPELLVIDSVASSPVTCPGNRDGSLYIYASGTGNYYEYSIDDGLNYYTSPWFQGLYGDNQFNIVVREDRACTQKYPRQIEFKEPDSIKINYHLISPSCETCPDGEINLRVSGGTPPYSVKWSTNDTITYLTNRVLGKYLVWVTDASRCRENALIDLTLDYPPFQIPNAFSPNGDGINEKWDVPALKDFPDCLVKIFNRSGEMIWWSDTGYPTPWDGTDKNGRVLPMGAYYYLVWLAVELKPLKGSVSILR